MAKNLPTATAKCSCEIVLIIQPSCMFFTERGESKSVENRFFSGENGSKIERLASRFFAKACCQCNAVVQKWGGKFRGFLKK